MGRALSFLTLLPIPGRAIPGEVGAALSFFPLAGLVIGLLVLGVEWGMSLAFPPLLSSAGAMVALLLITRGLHMDGFMDVCDGLGGGRTPQQRLAIMKDSRIGAFGAMGGFSLLLLKVLGLAALSGGPRYLALALMPALSRWGMVLTIFAFPYARPEGTGRAFKAAASRRRLAAATLWAFLIALGLMGLTGLALMALIAFLAPAVGGFLSRRLGGLTGDAYGAINEIAELTFLLLALPLARLLPYQGPWLWLSYFS